jgi:hypothetical protein
MIAIALKLQVNTDAELAALTGMANNSLVWHIGESCFFAFMADYGKGDVKPSLGGGYWVKEINIRGLNLAEYKAHRNVLIDQKTSNLIALGYVYKGYTFPLSQNGQINLLGMMEVKDLLTYPVALNNIEDTAVYNIVDATDLTNLYLTALATKKARLDAGTALKTQVNAAIDEAAVAAIIDNR